VSKSHYKVIKAGEFIFREGEPGTCAYLIDKGRVEVQVISKGVITPVNVFGIGDIFGEMSIIDGSSRACSAVALEECELIEVSKDQLNERIEDADPVVRLLISVLTNRIKGSLADPVEARKNPDATSTVINISELKDNQIILEKIKMEQNLRDALTDNEFRVHYQPIVNFKTGEAAGFEALMRWDSPERGMVRPDIFMGIAEETSLIIPLGHWLIKRVLRDFARLKKKLKVAGKNTDLFMSINIAAKQFNDPTLFKVLNQALTVNGIKASEIKLEITERVLIGGVFVYDWIKQARQLGYSVALDDFGTGYSSLSYLSNLEVNNLKIDKSFVEKMNTDAKTKHIVVALVNLAKSLNLSVIAEGVETQEEWNTLAEMDCDYVQGYLYSKPLPLNNVIALLSKPSRKKKAA
jgi:EAL domain-containing protein (putative c-di-GMP-specific phosphodiesterase class I)